MKDKNHNDYINDLKKYSANLLRSESNVRQFFKDAGIHTESGNLKKAYSEKSPTVNTSKISSKK